MELEITTRVVLYAGLIAAVLGAVAAKTNFCTMGAVSDWVNMGDTGRMGAWFFAIAIAISGVLIFEGMGMVDFGESKPPYRSATFAWPRYILGGLMFGVGMTLCSGCGNRNLIRVGGGNLKSILVVLVAGIMAYLMTKTAFYGTVFHSWMNPISIDLAAHGIDNQELGTLVASMTGTENTRTLNFVLGTIIVALFGFVLVRWKDFWSNWNNIIGGFVVGLVVLGGWYLTGGPMGQGWLETVEFMDQPPPSVGVQSYTFINPMGETLTYLASPVNPTLITFGVAALFGVIIGSFLYSIFTGNFRIEWFSSGSDFVNHMVGGVLIGTGGVLGLGCTIGQGVTGVSTLALGSFMTLASIILGSALTMKVQLYRMVYEDAGFVDALVTGLVDLRMLPKGLRRLNVV